MTTFEEFEQKLRATGDELEKIGKDVRKVLEIKDALQSSDDSLKTASDNLARLAVSSEENARALRECIFSLTDAVTTLNKINSIDFDLARASFQTEMFSANEKIEKISRIADDLPKKISDATRADSARTDRLLAAASRRDWFLVIAVTIILALLLFGHYLEYGLTQFSWLAPEVETTAITTNLADRFPSGPVA